MTFDDYCAAVREADVGFVLTHREVAPWQLDYSSLGIGSLQFGTDGGGSVSDGHVPGDKIIVVFKRCSAPFPIYLDGEPVGDTDFCFLGPGSHFVFSSQGPRSWLAVTLNAAAVAEAARSPAPLHVLGRRNWIVSASEPDFADILGLANLLHHSNHNFDLVASQRVLEHALARNLLSMLGRAKPNRLEAANHTSFVNLVHSALGCLRVNGNVTMRIDHLCSALGVSERTLLRAFSRVVEIGPKRFLRLRQLNFIRQALRNSASIGKHNVTDILTDYGVSELGRIAGEYRLLFGETPSETLINSKLNCKLKGRNSGGHSVATGRASR